MSPPAPVRPMPSTLHPPARTRARVLLVSARSAAAVGDDVRVAMLDILAVCEASVEDLVRGLSARGIRKAPTTLRHHLEVLKRAGLVTLARSESRNGAVLKYYVSTARLLNYELPEASAKRIEPAVRTAAARLRGVLEAIRARHGKEIRSVARRLRPCPYCDVQHFEEFVMAHVLQEAIGVALAPRRSG